MEKFKKDIEGTIYFLASAVNQLIDLAEKNGFYPKGELKLLQERQKAITKKYGKKATALSFGTKLCLSKEY